MPIDAPGLWQQVRLGEDSDLELKEARFQGPQGPAPRRDDLADEFTAFANAAGGRLVLGVSDESPAAVARPGATGRAGKPRERDLLGQHRATARVQHPPGPGAASGGGWRPACRDTGECRGSPHTAGLFSAARRLHSANAVRRGPAAVAVAGAIRRYRYRYSGPSHGTGINSLRSDVWRQYASSRANEPPEVALSKLKFLTDDRQGTLRATVGGVLLGAENPREWLPNAYIQAVRYRGDRMDGKPSAGCPGHRWTVGPTDPGCDALRDPQSERRRPQGSGTRRRAAIQRTRGVRGRRQRGGAPRLRGFGVADSACSCSTIAWSFIPPADCATP